MHLADIPLRTSVELQKAIDLLIPVSVFQHGEKIFEGGLIDLQTTEAVKFDDGSYFLKSTCEFRTR